MVLLLTSLAIVFAFAAGWLGAGILARLVGDRRLRRGTNGQGILALTFDDGPGGETTPALLDLLREHDARATFFLIGDSATRHPDIVERLASDGHTICWHSQTHRHQWKTDPIRGILDLWSPPAMLRREPTMARGFRPPYGKMTFGTWLVCRLRRWPIITWTHPSGDTFPRLPKVDDFVASVDRDGGGVVLMHDMDREDPARAEFVLQVTRDLLRLANHRDWKILSSPDDWRLLA